MIDSDSVLRRLPHGLPQKQIVFIDALRISAEIADQAYSDLHSDLHLLAAGKEANQSRDFVRVIRHTWTFIDAVHRFRTVLRVTPGIKHNHVYELFMRRSESVTDMRNTAQHLDQELTGIAKRSQGAYGTLSWVIGAGEELVPKPLMLNLGTAYGRVVGPVIDFEERLPAGEIRRIRLELADRLLMLSDVILHLTGMLSSLEASIAEFAEGKERFGSDQFMNFDFIPVNEEKLGSENN